MTVRDISGTATPVQNKVTEFAQRVARLKNTVEQGTLSYQVRQDVVALIEYVDSGCDTATSKKLHDAQEAVDDQKRLIEFFRDHPGWGAYGDVQNMTPGQCAIHYLTEYVKECRLRAEEVKNALNTPRTDADFEMVQRRAVVGEEPYYSPSVDPSERRQVKKVDPTVTIEVEGAPEHLIPPSEQDVWLELAKVSLRLGNSSEVAARVASEMLSAYRLAFARPAGLDLRKNSQI